MAPAQFPDHVVPVVEQVPDFDGVVAAFDVVRRSFLLVIIRAKNLILVVILVLVLVLVLFIVVRSSVNKIWSAK